MTYVGDTYQYLDQFNFVDLCLQMIYLIYVNKPDLALNNNSWYAIKPNQS